MASSRFRAEQDAAKAAMCRRLVGVFLPGLADSDPDNFELAFGFVAANLADTELAVNPRESAEWLAG